ncbi:MAG: deoxyhypusine synthase [Candidatus Anstonellales archaeon]
MDVEDFDKDALKEKKKWPNAGFQSSSLRAAMEIIERMEKSKATVFLAFTSNLVATGLRPLIAEIVKEKRVDAIITAGGSIDHDIIRASKRYKLYTGRSDAELHRKGINRLGNIEIGNECYEYLEQFAKKLFARLKGKVVSPSELIAGAGSMIKDSDSFLMWAHKNKIPVFSPGIVDSALGLQVYFNKQRDRAFGIDVARDMEMLAGIVLNAERTGAVVLGGGISKHYTIASNILRGGLDYAVYVTTASEWDGSLSGAKAEEAVSWGKIGAKADKVTVYGDATIIFPLLYSYFF